MNLTVCDHIVDFLENLKRVRIVIFFLHKFLEKAGSASCVAGCTNLIYLCKNCIIIAV